MTSSPAASDSVGDFLERIEEFCAEYVSRPEYRPRWPTEPKIVHDALWGTIRLHPWEIAILDLPLFQRLRQISQTSLVSYVFPGCRHSRFEHTLGVIHQTQKLAEAVNAQYPNSGDAPFDPNTIKHLRIAALFHDCGHSCFSHISENIYRHLPDMEAVTKPGSPYAVGNPHEILSALVLKSKHVRAYFDDLSSHYKVDFRLDEVADWIVGKPIAPNLAYIAHVINGPFDADKLDYLFRDAHFSGLPLNLDLDRLWSSCDRSSHKDHGNILTLRQSSVVALEQILFGKINLFSVVYQHPKVRAAECMFEATIDRVQADDGCKIAGRRLDKATDFLWLTDSAFFAEALRRDKDDLLHRAIHDILYRRYLVRALTISRDTCESGKADFRELRKLNHKSPEDKKERRKVAEAIWMRAGKPCEPHQVWLDLPDSPTLGGADHTYVRVPTGELRALTEYFPINYWNESYVSSKWRGHVFCPPHCQTQVYEAAKQVLHDRFNLKFTRLAGALSHVPGV